MIKETEQHNQSIYQDKAGKQDTLDEELSYRNRNLHDKLKSYNNSKNVKEFSAISMSKSSSYAMKLVSEFISGIFIGALLGYIVDKIFNIGPWGLITFLVLGFFASILNILRVIGKVEPSAFDKKKDKKIDKSAD